MRTKATAVLSISGLLLGSGSLYLVWNATTCMCPMQSVGQPLNCNCSPDLTVLAIPATIAMLSVIGLVYSFLASRTALRETQKSSTP
jgi:hypothetical protein